MKITLSASDKKKKKTDDLDDFKLLLNQFA